ncbi:hypothetical protein A6V39_05640 [Candidatus Mycoplasma haematobovis]|uniref:Uncharacterized protein n=1 Tax=Candidatus Mycoplasma haematobovis TaxID=432608 RepID=A0A1A9QGG9_9MOLU|nr:hypothetical protein [Candidatus Mycoplasma haematobovis]OAL10820.1 hypothetical protein A6V39_05640 [Candidatus Mycoplasma haematobovis]
MLQRSLSISLGTTAFVGSAGLIASYLSGGFSNTFPMKTIVWNNKPKSIPKVMDNGYIEDPVSRKRWEAKELDLIFKTNNKEDHPWWKELLKVLGKDKFNVPVLIAKWCMSNNDITVDITSDKGQMLEKLCDVSFK